MVYTKGKVKDGMIERLSKTIPKSSAKGLMVLLVATGAALGLHVLGVLLGLGLETATVLRFPPALLAVWVIWQASGFHQGRTRTGWRLVGLAAAMWFLGDVAYGICEVLLRLDTTTVPWLSLLYFAATFAMISSVAFLGYFPRNPSERFALLLETLIIVIGSGTFGWMWFRQWSALGWLALCFLICSANAKHCKPVFY
jgi:hypothetical protein